MMRKTKRGGGFFSVPFYQSAAESGMEHPGVDLAGTSFTLTLTMADGNVVKKNASSNLSIEIYNLLLPYFINNQS